MVREFHSLVGSLKAANINVGGFTYAEAKPHLSFPAPLVFLLFKSFFDESTVPEATQSNVWTNSCELDPNSFFSISFDKVFDSILNELFNSHVSFIYSEFVSFVIKSEHLQAQTNERFETSFTNQAISGEGRRKNGLSKGSDRLKHFGTCFEGGLQCLLPKFPKARSQKSSHQKTAFRFLQLSRQTKVNKMSE